MGVDGTYRIAVDRLCFTSFKQHSVCTCIMEAIYMCVYIGIFVFLLYELPFFFC